MTLRISNLVALLMIAFFFSGCSDDDDGGQNQNPNPNMPQNVVDPGDLPEGGAQVSGGGAETFYITDASSSWRKSGAFTSSGRTYAGTEVNLETSTGDVDVRIVFYVHDTAANMFGGELPSEGAYDIGLTTAEMSSPDTERFAEIYVSGDALDYFYSHETDSEGDITITSFDGEVMEGRVDVQGLGDFDAPEGTVLNFAASFKAPEE